MSELPFQVEEIKRQFDLSGDYTGYDRINNGHINNTYVLHFQENSCCKDFLLQQINTHVFRNPDELMENIVGVTSYLRQQIEQAGGDPARETLTVYHTADGKPYYKDGQGHCWRVYNFISSAYTCQSITEPVVFYNAAKAFGTFQRMLADYPSESLHETIPNFHNTISRFQDLLAAIEADEAGRAKLVQEEIAFAKAREADCRVLLDLVAADELPLRVTHNDTKLNNVMFDNDTKQGICVIDLDTVMPGLSLYDFGDSIRFGANTAAEDEKDLSLVSLDLNLFEQYVKGYLSAAGESLTQAERDYLAFSAKLMTFECGIRFLTDYLNGDTYCCRIWSAKWSRCRRSFPKHNLQNPKGMISDEIQSDYGGCGVDCGRRLYRRADLGVLWACAGGKMDGKAAFPAG